MTLEKLQNLDNKTELVFEGDRIHRYYKQETGIERTVGKTKQGEIMPWAVIQAIGVNRWRIKYVKK